MAQRVLVVDDDAEVRASIRAVLESYDFTIAEARDSREALEMIGQGVPDVVITDIYMPNGDGYELLNAIRTHTPRIPLIAMSGARASGAVDQLAMAERLGAVAILDKPFRPSNLVEMIDRAIAGRGAPARR
jgi:CheY-like chemotaxis protein